MPTYRQRQEGDRKGHLRYHWMILELVAIN